MVEMLMMSWNFKLVNVQRACKEHLWKCHNSPNAGPQDETKKHVLNLELLIEEPDGEPELIRIPANIKSRFQLE